jgi:hypothetical protein
MTTAIKKYMTARKAAWGRMSPPIKTRCKGGPLNGLSLVLHDSDSTLPFVLGGSVGRYVGGKWERA